MAAATIQLELHFDGRWWHAADLTLEDPNAGTRSATRLAYRDEYLVEHASRLGSCDERTVSERFPLEFEVWRNTRWPAFTLDIVPAGAARRWWRRRLAADDIDDQRLDFLLLRDHTRSPIGHMRVGQVDGDAAAEPIPFTKDEVCRRSVGFLEYAAELGAAIGGATGAGGDAPKVLLVEDDAGNVYPDGALPDERAVAHWLVKWPRGRDTARDRLVLRTEYLYSQALAQLGFDVCPGQWHRVDDGKPSLWLPRFDRTVSEGEVVRLAVESFYSLAGVSQPGAVVPHERFLEALAEALKRRGQGGRLPGLVAEYLCRDLLDVIVGNSDNHGRNRAVLRSASLGLAPIYDLAPMVMDPEGIVRSSRWREHERGGRIDWPGLCSALSSWADPGDLEEALCDFGQRLMPLPDLLHDAGLDNEVMNFPRIYLRNLETTLEHWGLR